LYIKSSLFLFSFKLVSCTSMSCELSSFVHLLLTLYYLISL
jgi:hypothetical protein